MTEGLQFYGSYVMIISDKCKLTEKDVQLIEESLARKHTVEIKTINGKLIISEVRRKVKKALDNA